MEFEATWYLFGLRHAGEALMTINDAISRLDQRHVAPIVSDLSSNPVVVAGVPLTQPSPLRLDPTKLRPVQVQTPPLELFRWATIAVGGVMAAGDFFDKPFPNLVSFIALAGYAAFRTLRPIEINADHDNRREIWLEFIIHTVLVLLTGTWSSPFVIVLLPTIVLAGFARGYLAALQMSVLGTLVQAIVFYQRSVDSLQNTITATGGWFALFATVSIVSAYTQRFLEDNARQQSMTVERLGRLAEANALLYQLNKIAQTLPSSLDMAEVLDSTIARLRDLIPFDAVTVMLLEESDRTWVPVREVGNPGQTALSTSQLPSVCLKAFGHQGAMIEPHLGDENGHGLLPSAQSGLYAVLSARGTQIGLIALEASVPSKFRTGDVEVLNGITDSFAYAVSNARLFSRLRNIGAEEERTRIARDLHDQIGQALAHLGFEMDRAVRAADRGEQQMRPRLDELRNEVKGVTRMVRDTLYDLRTDVTESQDVRATMELFVSRVRERSGLDVSMDVKSSGRLPLIQEREMWRIAKEAVINVERHARASKLAIRWRCDGRTAELVVSDDGVGLDATAARMDSYGIMGMKERATSIGARLELESSPGEGTQVRVTVSNP